MPLLGPTDRLVAIPPVNLRDAATGAPPRLRTAVRVGFRHGSLVVRFDGRDDGVVASLRRRDEPLWTEDVYEVFVTPFDPPVVYFEFEVNPLGALFDARVESPGLARATMKADVGWDLPGLRGTSRVQPGRWSATLTIPLATLVPGSLPRSWRANFCRIDRGGTDEYSAWARTGADPVDFHVAARFGVILLPLSATTA